MRNYKHFLYLAALFLLSALPAHAQFQNARGWCELGAQPIVLQGLFSTTLAQASFPQCLVTVNVHGGGLATIFSNTIGTPLANPFIAATNGQWLFYAANGEYDVITSGGGTPPSLGFPTPVTYFDVFIGTSGGGGGTVPHDLLSATHLDTIPFSPPARGSLITAQNLTSPTGANPSWAQLTLGVAKQCLTSNGTDAIWNGCWWTVYNNGALAGTEQGVNFIPGTNTTLTIADNPGFSRVDVTINSTGGSGSVGCTITGLQATWVLSVNPAATCYGSADFTWNDGTNLKNLMVGDGTNTLSTDGSGANNLQVILGSSNGSFGTYTYTLGLQNQIGESTSPQFMAGALGRSNTLCTAGTEGTAGCNNTWTVGEFNSISGRNSISIGNTNHTTEAAPVGSTVWPQFAYILGEANTAAFAGTGTSPAAQLKDMYIFGASNSATATSNAAQVFNDVLIGQTNTITANGTSSSGSSTAAVQRVHMLGNGNSLTLTNNAANAASFWAGIYVVGGGNTLSITEPSTTPSAIQNSNIAILGTGNTVSNTNAFGGGQISNGAIVGTSNTISFAPSFLAAYGNLYEFGFNESITSGNDCFLFGEDAVVSSCLRYIGIGLSATPEITIAPGAVTINGGLTPSSISTPGQITSTVPFGTAPIVITSATPVANLTLNNHPQMEYCGATSGATQNCAKTKETAALIIFGDVTLNTATSQSITTLPFTSASSYSCAGSDLTTIAGIVSFNTYAAASVTIQESGGVNTDHLRYICTGF